MITPMDDGLEHRLTSQATADGVGRLVVGGLLTRAGPDGPRLLVLERAADDFMGGIEELPSGKVEAGEPLGVALRREVMEETGLTVRAIRGFAFAFDYRSSKGVLTRQFNFVVEAEPGEVKVAPQEHSGFRWIGAAELDASKLTPNIRAALRQVWGSLPAE